MANGNCMKKEEAGCYFFFIRNFDHEAFSHQKNNQKGRKNKLWSVEDWFEFKNCNMSALKLSLQGFSQCHSL